jgi:hypothetical protein
MITDSLDLKPLGGIYQGRYWPVAERDIPELENHLGRPLPESYRQLLTTFGTSRPAKYMAVDLPDGTSVGFENFLGGEKEDRDLGSVFGWVRFNAAPERYPELMRYVVIGNAINGRFFLGPDGTIYYERTGFYELTWVAASFDDFVRALYIDPNFMEE